VQERKVPGLLQRQDQRVSVEEANNEREVHRGVRRGVLPGAEDADAAGPPHLQRRHPVHQGARGCPQVRVLENAERPVSQQMKIVKKTKNKKKDFFFFYESLFAVF
jgi:hypothetical protein